MTAGMSLDYVIESVSAVERLPEGIFMEIASSFAMDEHYARDSAWPWFHKAPMGFLSKWRSSSIPQQRGFAEELFRVAMETAAS